MKYILISIFALLFSNAFGATHYVTSETNGTNVGQLQWCIDNSVNGDTIEFTTNVLYSNYHSNPLFGYGTQYRIYIGNGIRIYTFSLNIPNINTIFYNITFINSYNMNLSGYYFNCRFTGIIDGTIYMVQKTILTNCIIYENSTDRLLIDMYNSDGIDTIQLYNCNIVDNYCWSILIANYGTGIYNSIIYHNNVESSAPEFQGNFHIYNSLIQNWEIYNYFIIEHGINISTNPLFIDIYTDNYKLSNISPCINAGNNTYNMQSVDLAGNPRIQDNTIDIGCYEYTSTPAPLTIYPGDANNDGICNIVDYFLVASANGKNGYWRTQEGTLWQPYVKQDNWATSSTCQGTVINNCYLDCNGDGVINLFDVAVTILNRNKTHN